MVPFFHTEVTDRAMMDYQTQSIMPVVLCKAIRDRQCNGNGKLVTNWKSGVKFMESNICFHKNRACGGSSRTQPFCVIRRLRLSGP